MSRARNFCFTDFVLDEQFWTNVGDRLPCYIRYGRETCPKTGKEHFQGFIHFKEKMSMSSVIQLLTPRHVEICRGSLTSNLAYTSKEGDWVELGVAPHQGTRSDLEDIKSMIISHCSDRAIFEKYPGDYIRYHKGIEKVRTLYCDKRNWVMDVRIYWGRPGTGKTRSVWEEFSDVYPKMPGKWWDSYRGEDCVLIDDFDPDNCFDSTFDWYLKLLDRYPLMVEMKGSSCHFVSKTIIFTSNFNPKSWFMFKSNRDAFFRRVTCIREFGE